MFIWKTPDATKVTDGRKCSTNVVSEAIVEGDHANLGLLTHQGEGPGRRTVVGILPKKLCQTVQEILVSQPGSEELECTFSAL